MTRKVVLFLLALALVIATWELYKVVGPERGGTVIGWRILPRADDGSMPHVWTILSRFGDPELRGSSRTVGQVVLEGMWFTFRVAMVGFVIGVIVGLGLAILMQRFRLAERSLLPYVILSQTVPLVALAIIIAGLWTFTATHLALFKLQRNEPGRPRGTIGWSEASEGSDSDLRTRALERVRNSGFVPPALIMAILAGIWIWILGSVSGQAPARAGSSHSAPPAASVAGQTG